MTVIAPLPVAVPLATAALLLMFGTVLPGRVVRAVTIAATLAEIALAGALVYGARSGAIVYWFGGWTPHHGVALGVAFAVDRMGAGAAAFAGIIVTAAVMIARRSFNDRLALTHALMLTMLAAMAGFCLTGDIFNLFVFYELMAVSAFGLAAFITSNTRSLRAALNFAITNSVGAFLLLIGIALLYGRTGALNLAQIGRDLATARHPDGLVVIAVTTITVGFLVKAAIVPFHFWLVDLASSGSLPLVLIFAGALDTLAVYGLARVYWTVFAPALGAHNGPLRELLLAFGAATALLGAVLALNAEGVRRKLAFVLVSHTGTLLVGVGCLTALGVAGAAIYAVADGAIKAAIFACAGTLERDDPKASGVVPIVMLTAGGLALAGFPLFGVALGESAIERAASRAGNPWVVPVLIVASVLTGAAVLRIAVAAARERGLHRHASELSSVATVLVGLAIAARFALTHWAAGSASAFVSSTSYARAVLDGVRAAPITAVGHVGIAATAEVLDVFVVCVALAVVAWLDWSRPARRVAGPHVSDIAHAVRRLHVGSPGDSVAWLMVGATTFAVVLGLALR